MQTKQLGKYGEDLALRFLKEKGFQLRCRNYRHGHSEIDLIVEKEGILVFVEVKTRSSNCFGEPEEMISDNQIEKIQEAAEEYMESFNWLMPIRFDVISIVKRDGKDELMHLEDAF